MNSEKKPLSVRRAHLIAECAQQRGDLADELNTLKAPVEHIGGVGSFLFANRKAVLAGGGVALGLLIARPKRALAMAAAGTSLWKMAQAALPRVMPLVQRVLPVLREHLPARFQ